MAEQSAYQKTAVKLNVMGCKSREVLSFSYKFNRAVDIEGQIAGVPRGGQISLTVTARNDGNVDLLHWMLEPHLPKDGSIQFKQRGDSGATMKTIHFFDAQCIEYTESWNDGKESNYDGHTEKIILTCRSIENGGVIYLFTWE